MNGTNYTNQPAVYQHQHCLATPCTRQLFPGNRRLVVQCNRAGRVIAQQVERGACGRGGEGMGPVGQRDLAWLARRGRQQCGHDTLFFPPGDHWPIIGQLWSQLRWPVLCVRRQRCHWRSELQLLTYVTASSSSCCVDDLLNVSQAGKVLLHRAAATGTRPGLCPQAGISCC